MRIWWGASEMLRLETWSGVGLVSRNSMDQGFGLGVRNCRISFITRSA